MATTVKTTTISNISKQPVGILFSNTLNPAAGDIPTGDKGILTIHPGKSVTLESNRLDAGQLQNFASKNLVAISQGVSQGAN